MESHFLGLAPSQPNRCGAKQRGVSQMMGRESKDVEATFSRNLKLPCFMHLPTLERHSQGGKGGLWHLIACCLACARKKNYLGPPLPRPRAPLRVFLMDHGFHIFKRVGKNFRLGTNQGVSHRKHVVIMLFVFHREIFMVWSDEQWCFDGRSLLGPRFAASQSCQPFCIGNSTNVRELSSWPVHVSGKAMLSASQWWVSGQAALRDAENDNINKNYVLKGFFPGNLHDNQFRKFCYLLSDILLSCLRPLIS